MNPKAPFYRVTSGDDAPHAGSATRKHWLRLEMAVNGFQDFADESKARRYAKTMANHFDHPTTIEFHNLPHLDSGFCEIEHIYPDCLKCANRGEVWDPKAYTQWRPCPQCRPWKPLKPENRETQWK